MNNDVEFYKILRKDVKLQDAIKKHNRYCKYCGHTMTLLNVDRILCSWCGHWVYKDDKTEFMYKMKEQMRKKGS